MLSRSGIVTSNSYRGVSVREVDADFVRSVYGVRLLLEPHAVTCAVPRMGPEQHFRLAELLEESSRHLGPQEPAVLSRLNRRFHRELYRFCGNGLLVEFLDNLQDRLALIAVTKWAQRPSWDDEAREHASILDAVRGGDAARAGKLLEEHLRRFQEGSERTLD